MTAALVAKTKVMELPMSAKSSNASIVMLLATQLTTRTSKI
jgi:hypothetical protein